MEDAGHVSENFLKTNSIWTEDWSKICDRECKAVKKSFHYSRVNCLICSVNWILTELAWRMTSKLLSFSPTIQTASALSKIIYWCFFWPDHSYLNNNNYVLPTKWMHLNIDISFTSNLWSNHKSQNIEAVQSAMLICKLSMLFRNV